MRDKIKRDKNQVYVTLNPMRVNLGLENEGLKREKDRNHGVLKPMLTVYWILFQ